MSTTRHSGSYLKAKEQRLIAEIVQLHRKGFDKLEVTLEVTKQDLPAFVPELLRQTPRRSIKEVCNYAGGHTYFQMRTLILKLEREGIIRRTLEKPQLTKQGNCPSWLWEPVP